jgi:hypothetical protein
MTTLKFLAPRPSLESLRKQAKKLAGEIAQWKRPGSCPSPCAVAELRNATVSA